MSLSAAEPCAKKALRAVPRNSDPHGSAAEAENIHGIVLDSLTAMRALKGHSFWPDDISLADGKYVDGSRLSSHAQVTDSYLLALAVAHGGRLASMDRKLVVDAVKSGRQALALI